MVHQSKYGKPLYVLVTAFLQRAIASKRFLKHAPSFFREKKNLIFFIFAKDGISIEKLLNYIKVCEVHVWIYENHMWELRGKELYDRGSTQL